jgi:hypothetical protein
MIQSYCLIIVIKFDIFNSSNQFYWVEVNTGPIIGKMITAIRAN